MSGTSTLMVDLGDLRDSVHDLLNERAANAARVDLLEEAVSDVSDEVSDLRTLLRDNHGAVMAALDERKQAADRRAVLVGKIVERVTERDFLIFAGVVLVVLTVVFGGAAFDSEYFKINSPATNADVLDAVSSGETAVSD